MQHPFLRRMSLIPPLTLMCFLSLTIPAAAQVDMLTQHGNNARTGANLQETILNTSNVNVAQFGKLFARSVDGQVYAQPLVVCGLDFHSKGKHDVLYVATEHNSVYAFDADNPSESAPLWHVNLGPSAPYTDFYTGIWTDMDEEVGITSTPVIDPASHTIYVEAKTKENGQYFHRLHALDLITGKEKPGSPVTIQAQVPGTGIDAVNGVVTFNQKMQLQRPGLLLDEGIVFLGFGSHAIVEPYHGWLLGYDAKTLKQIFVFNTTPNGSEGSIWQSGQGPAADADGTIYVSLGNGPNTGIGDADVQKGGSDYADCLLKINPKPTGSPIIDYFLPHDFAEMSQGDRDFGSSGPMLFPGTNLVISGSKEGDIYVADRSNLGHFHPNDDDQIIQHFMGGNAHIHGSVIGWVTPNNDKVIYVWSEEDYMHSFKWQDGKFVPWITGPTRVPDGMPGGFLSISSDGNRAGTGILWATHPLNTDGNWATVVGLLQAFDASDPSKELWNSRQNPTRDDLGYFAKFCPPTVVNGKVYLATFSRQVVVYGLLPKN